MFHLLGNRSRLPSLQEGHAGESAPPTDGSLGEGNCALIEVFSEEAIDEALSSANVTVFDEGGPAGGGVLIYPSKYLVHQQKRNLLGLETDTSGDLFLRSLQSDAADDVAPSSFRMLFVHLATGLPAMDLYANDDVLLTTVSSKAERGDVLP